MKQYTDKDQNAKLIELGFLFPKSIIGIRHVLGLEDGRYKIDFENAYSIGELIEYLPITIEWTPRIIMENEIKYSFATMDSTLYSCNKNNELIDNLFDMCVKLKEEGMI